MDEIVLGDRLSLFFMSRWYGVGFAFSVILSSLRSRHIKHDMATILFKKRNGALTF